MPKTLFDYVLTDAENNELYRRLRNAYNDYTKLWHFMSSRGCYSNDDIRDAVDEVIELQNDLNNSHEPSDMPSPADVYAAQQAAIAAGAFDR